ncbi:MAG: hypothetical protein IJC83_01585 [Oscillospiraceae bacterium]|nr:hypothetical protein [Oscillospiraceae bacterium]
MTSQKLSFKKMLSLYLNILSRYKGLIIGYMLVAFLVMPLPEILNSVSLLQRGINQKYNTVTLPYYSSGTIFLLAIALLVMVVVTTAIVFSYMQSRKSVDVMHSLPLNRYELFISYATAGFTIILLPILTAFISEVFVIKGFGIYNFSAGIFLSEMLKWIVVALAFYALMVLITVNVGTIFDSIVFTLGVNVAIPAIYGFMTIAFQNTLVGYNTASSATGEIIFSLSPGAMGIKLLLAEGEGLVTAIISWLILAGMILVLSAFLYSKRKSEVGGLSNSQGVLTIIVKVLGALTVAFAFNALFESILNSRAGGILGFFIGLLVSYFIIQLIIARGFKNFKKAVFECLALAIAGTIFFVILETGGLGFETRVPKPEKVDKVYISYNGGFSNEGSYFYGGYKSDEMGYTSPEVIEKVISAHSEIVKRPDLGARASARNGSYNQAEVDVNSLYIVYELKNGSTLDRYYVGTDVVAGEILASLNDCDEYIEKNYMLNRFDKERLDNVYIMDKFEHSAYFEIDADFDILQQAILTDLKSNKGERAIQPSEMPELILTFHINTITQADKDRIEKNIKNRNYGIKEAEEYRERQYAQYFDDLEIEIYSYYTQTMKYLKAEFAEELEEAKVDANTFKKAYVIKTDALNSSTSSGFFKTNYNEIENVARYTKTLDDYDDGFVIDIATEEAMTIPAGMSYDEYIKYGEATSDDVFVMLDANPAVYKTDEVDKIAELIANSKTEYRVRPFEEGYLVAYMYEVQDTDGNIYPALSKTYYIPSEKAPSYISVQD